MNPRRLYLNSQALRHNFQQVRNYAPHTKVLAMLKANGYGHGIVWVAQTLAAAGVDAIGVACLEEGMQLREAGIQIPILLMSEGEDLVRYQLAQQNHLGIVLHDKAQLEPLKKLNSNLPLWLWIKVDTGMHRLGIAPENLKSIRDAINNLPHVQKPMGVLAHFSCASSSDQVVTLTQMEQFNTACHVLNSDEYFTSLASSAAIIAYPESHASWVRPGIMLYGSSPFKYKTAESLNLLPVMTIKSKIIAIHTFPAGAAIGYDATFICQRPSRIAVVAFGYGDGYPRDLHQTSYVNVNNKRIAIVGRISMDMITIDITEHDDIKLEDDVTLFGEGLPIDELAQAANTISYEIFCRLTKNRIKVEYL